MRIVFWTRFDMTQAVMCQEDPGEVTLSINTGGGNLKNSGNIDAVRDRLLC